MCLAILLSIVNFISYWTNVTSFLVPNPLMNISSVNKTVHRRDYGGKLVMIWLPNNEGLFATFLSLRVMMHYMNQVGPSSRLLVVPPRHSTTHFSGKRVDAMDLCRIFSLSPSGVICPKQTMKTAKTLCNCNSLTDRRRMICLNAPKLLEWMNNAALRSRLREANICYKDSYIPLPGMVTHREVTLSAVNMPMPKFRFGEAYTVWVRAFQRSLLTLGGLEGSQNSFTVVHWRRGDQLTSRCSARQGKDVSVNCRNASSLLKLVERIRSHRIVYVATNEPRNSSQLQ